jgi:predicted N-acetyltransferase YhbS
MTNITVNKNNNPAYEQMFDNLIQEVFGFSFAPWLACKLWDERYESYSIIEKGKMLSNICMFKVDMLVNGKNIRAHQFGAVATRESERGKGLSRILMEYVLALYPNTPAFLASNSSVLDFYPKFGFRQVQTYRPGLRVGIDSALTNAVNHESDDVFIKNALSANRMYSSILDCTNAQPVQKFHLLLEYAEGIYHLPDCNAIIITEQNGDRLFLADVIAPEPILFDDLVNELPFKGVEYIEFGFCPDWLGIEPEWIPEDMDENPFFVRGDWDLPEFFRMPVMSQT